MSRSLTQIATQRFPGVGLVDERTSHLNVLESLRDEDRRGCSPEGCPRTAKRRSGRWLAASLVLVVGPVGGADKPGIAVPATANAIEGVPPTLGRTLPADDVIFLQMFRPHRDAGTPDLPWTISGRMIPVTRDTPETDIPFLLRWEALATAFSLMTDTRSTSYDGQFANRVRAVAQVAVNQLGPRPEELPFRRTVFQLLGEAGLLSEIRKNAESRGSRPVGAVPDWAWKNIEAPSDGRAAPALTVSPTLPEPMLGCERIFAYCPRRRALTLQVLGDATLPTCLSLHRDLSATRPDYRARVDAVFAELEPLANEVDPASAESIRSLTSLLYERLESAGIAGELQDAFDGRMR